MDEAAKTGHIFAMTDEPQTQDLLRDVSLLDSIINTAPDAIITISDNGTIRSFSPAAEEMFEMEAIEAIGQNIKILMPEPFRSEHDGHLSRYRKTNEKHIIGIGREVKAQRKSGEIFSAELAVGELKLDGVRIFTGFIRDISDRVEAVRKADELQRELAHLSRVLSLGEMSTSLAHELNQPLGALSNYAMAAKRLLESDPPDLVKASGLLEQISAQARRAGETIKRMRDFIQRGEIELEPESLAEVAREAVRMVQVNARHSNVSILTELEEQIPKVLIDRIQIQQVLVNLLRNSIDAIVGEDEDPNGEAAVKVGGRREVLLRVARADKNHAFLIVEDSGPGLSDVMMETAFVPFRTSKRSGLGVGLSICKSIVEAHGGKIEAENRPNDGARFTVFLPLDGVDESV